MTTGKQVLDDIRQAGQAGGKSPTQSGGDGSSRQLPEALRGKEQPSLEVFQGLTPEQRGAHRESIGVRVEAILMQFWREEGTPDAVAALEIEGWMDVLEYTTPHEIRTAWADYQKAGPRTKTGKLYRPDAGAIHALITRRRRENQPSPQARPEPQRTEPRVTDEERARIFKEHGMEHMGGSVGQLLKRFPEVK